MKKSSAFIAGLLFGAGLAASGMTDTRKVIGFLDIFGNWDPDLIFVMGAAVITTFIGYKLVLGRDSGPLFVPHFSLPTKSDLDRKLVIGAAIFGLGWSLYGYCPGPAIASLIYLSPITLGFVVAMVVGMTIGNFLSKKL